MSKARASFFSLARDDDDDPRKAKASCLSTKNSLCLSYSHNYIPGDGHPPWAHSLIESEARRNEAMKEAGQRGAHVFGAPLGQARKRVALRFCLPGTLVVSVPPSLGPRASQGRRE